MHTQSIKLPFNNVKLGSLTPFHAAGSSVPQPIGIAYNRPCPEDLKVVVPLVVNITSDIPFVIEVKDGSDSVGMQGMIF